MTSPYELRRVVVLAQGWAGMAVLGGGGASIGEFLHGWPVAHRVLLIGLVLIAVMVVVWLGRQLQRLDRAICTDPALLSAYRRGEADQRRKEREGRIADLQRELKRLYDAQARALFHGNVDFARTFNGDIAVLESRLRQFGA